LIVKSKRLQYGIIGTIGSVYFGIAINNFFDRNPSPMKLDTYETGNVSEQRYLASRYVSLEDTNGSENYRVQVEIPVKKKIVASKFLGRLNLF
jgi:hypothetical protein